MRRDSCNLGSVGCAFGGVGMAAEWNEMWSAATALIGRQPPAVQIFGGLGLAFTALMFVEGLRASFLPRRFDGNAAKRSSVAISGVQMGQEKPRTLLLSSGVERSRALQQRNRKLTTDAPRRHRGMKPIIRRMSSPFDRDQPRVVETESSQGLESASER